ncbi:Acyl-CoA N-acyltransferase [Cordyceps javanica]|uniref:Acyl-CoA N-acyltransferase n=1 Tax=Cordyceps javanica TaxID=43265 RepID=A0A545V7P9_9HYPO|nr:Acyl-CoA N-acyltransferase [Cordyceps javanica]TQW09073.1 Acyl-CoA N-acyltransferase [Cordyceps javanica]
MKVRAATDADVPAIAAIVLAVASAEAPWKSYLPARLRCDPALVQHAEAVARGYLEAGEQTSVVMVAELAAAGEAGRDAPPEIVSVAVWDTRAARPKTDPTGYISSRQDDDWKLPAGVGEHPKLTALSDAMRRGRHRYFAAEGPHIFLRVLATHPDHQGRGHAKALCRWGIAFAHRKRVAVCLETGSRGYIMLSGMGFRDLGAVVVPAGNGYDEQVLKALHLDAAGAQAANPGVWDSLWKYIST